MIRNASHVLVMLVIIDQVFYDGRYTDAARLIFSQILIHLR
jgi:hypothetical protein